jgi:hypothetical protein
MGVISDIQKLGFVCSECRDDTGEVILIRYTKDHILIELTNKKSYTVSEDGVVILHSGYLSPKHDWESLSQYVKLLKRKETIKKLLDEKD